MSTLKTLYNLLQVNRKITDTGMRLLYLKDVWGLEQAVIGELEDVSQSYVSKEIIKTRKIVSRETLELETNELWSPEEIQYIHFLPREILPDIAAIAFINDILGYHPIHPFFDYMDTGANARIAALAWLGVMNKRLVEMFKKNQPTVSMIVKRSIGRVSTIERPTRYLPVSEYRFYNKDNIKSTKFLLAGGQNYEMD